MGHDYVEQQCYPLFIIKLGSPYTYRGVGMIGVLATNCRPLMGNLRRWVDSSRACHGHVFRAEEGRGRNTYVSCGRGVNEANCLTRR